MSHSRPDDSTRPIPDHEPLSELFQSLTEETTQPFQRSTGASRLPGDVVEGRYVIEAYLGGGAMGEVYLARDMRVEDRRVAVKFLDRSFAERNSAALEQFRTEVRSLDRPRHMHVATILDASAPDDPEPFVVMDYVAGRTLRDVLAGSPPPSRDAIIRAIVDVCRGVEHLHSVGILHRDLKPGNVVVRDDGTAVVIDLGVAVDLAGPSDGAPPRLVGTPSYISPDQLRHVPGELDERADVYSIGIMLFEALTGELPYTVREQDRDALLAQVNDAPVRRPSSVRADIPADLDAIVLRATARNRADRYPGAAALADDLQRFLDSRPVAARTAGGHAIGYRVGKWIRRRPLHAAASAGALVVLSILAVLLLSAQRERAELQRRLDETVSVMADLSEGRTDGREVIAELRADTDPEAARLAESLEMMVELLEAGQTLRASGPIPGGMPALSETPTTVRAASGRPWRPRAYREMVTRLVDDIEARHGELVAYPPPEVDVRPTLHLASILVTLDQLDRAAEVLARVPASARDDWHYRYVAAVSGARQGTSDAVSVREAEASLRTLLDEARTRPDLTSEVPEVLVNLALLAQARGDLDAFARWLEEAKAHPDAGGSLVSWIEEVENAQGWGVSG